MNAFDSDLGYRQGGLSLHDCFYSVILHAIWAEQNTYNTSTY